jgi:hypothetical protein
VSHSSSPLSRPFPTCQQRTDELNDALRNTPRSPCVDQMEADIEAYYRKAQIGELAAVRRTHGGMLYYEITEIGGTNPKLGRVYVRGHGAFYMKHGKNCWQPKGQTTLVVPTGPVVAWALEYPGGAFGFMTFKASDYPFP